MQLRTGVVAVWTAAWVAAAGPLEWRWVWIFGWDLNRDDDAEAMIATLERAARAGANGAVISAGFDTLCKKSPDQWRRIERIRETCERLGLELIPAIFGVGYGGGILAHDRNLAEGLPVEAARFVVHGGRARLVPDPPVALTNGGFEEFRGHRFAGYRFHDEPGTISFADTTVWRGGAASIRFENFRARPAGNARVMQEVAVRPRRCYRVRLWVRTEGLEPAGAFHVKVLAGGRELAPRTFRLSGTRDWTRLTTVFNSMDHDRVALYAGVWGGRSGRFWLDDWTLEEIGPLNVLRRPGTPVRVRGAGGVEYEEGRDYARLEDAALNPWRVEGEPLELRIPEGSRIREGEELRVNWYHSMIIHDSQVVCCLAEPALYDIFEHEAALLADRLRPRTVLLNMDEIRMGGSCRACRGRNMDELLAECVRRQAEILRRHRPGLRVVVWSDMFDPHHNARDRYYLVEGNLTGSWRHLPRDLAMAVWGGAPRPESLRHFEAERFPILIANYYDASGLDDVRRWRELAAGMNAVHGFMYTTWRRNYDLLDEYATLVWGAPPAAAAPKGEANK